MGAGMLLSVAPTGPAVFPTTMTEADRAAFRDLEAKLPPGWGVEVEKEPGAGWCATVTGPDGPLMEPVFIICQLRGHSSLFVRWMDGSTLSTYASPALAPVLDTIPSGIFAGAEARLATVHAEGWHDVRH